MLDRFPDDRDAVLRTSEIAERLEFDLTEELGYRYPDFSDGTEPAIVQLRRVCETAFAERYSPPQRPQEARPQAARGGARPHRRARPRRLLPAPLGGARARARGRARGARAGLDAPRPAAGARARLLGRLARLLPHRPLARRSGREQPLARPLPQPRARVHPRHRPRLPARHPGEAHRPRRRALRPRARLARRGVRDVPLARRDPRRRQGARPAVRRPRAARAPHRRLERAARRRRDRGAARRRAQAPVAALARVRRALHRDRRPAAAHLPAPRRDGHLDAPARRARPRPAGRDGGTADVPVGQGLVRRRRLPQDRPARARGCSRRSRSASTSSRSTAARAIDLSRVPLDDKDVFAEIQRADTVGCFQIESRAQMQVILRTRPETIDDITVQVALVRPGPIQGGAVHPYIERRQKLRDDPTFRAPADHPLLEEPLRETLGVIVFQDQVLDVAVHLAGFTVGEAEGLRRAMIAEALARGARGVARAVRRGRAREGRRGAAGARALRQARRVLRLRLPEVALGGVRAARVPVGVAAAPLRGGVPRGAVERAADGLLSARDARARRAAARGRDAPAARQPQRGRLRDRGRRRPRRAEVRRRRGGGRRGSRRRRAAVLHRYGSSRSGRGCRRTSCARSSRSGACDCFGLRAARAPVAARPRAAAVVRPRHGRARRSSSRSRSTRPRRRRTCPSRRCGSGCSPTTARRASRSASTRSRSCGRTSRRGR